jgi:hypothetical protein
MGLIGERVTKLACNPPAWNTMAMESCGGLPGWVRWDDGRDVLSGRFLRSTWDFARWLSRSSSRASGGHAGQPDTFSGCPSRCDLIRMAFPWNTFPQWEHLTCHAMPCFAGSFTTETCPHSPPFTLTMAHTRTCHPSTHAVSVPEHNSTHLDGDQLSWHSYGNEKKCISMCIVPSSESSASHVDKPEKFRPRKTSEPRHHHHSHICCIRKNKSTPKRITSQRPSKKGDLTPITDRHYLTSSKN